MSDFRDRLTAAIADRYVIERELGEGGMAIVFQAADRKHGRKVALKALRPELSATLGADRFLREIRTVAQLNHPHILPLLDSGDVDGMLYYTMPIVEGESLGTRIVRDGPLAVRDVVALARDVGAALDYAHARGVVHRDIKPRNILLHHGEPMVADFGIALAVSEAGGERLTETGLSVGTPQYMSPEQVSGDRKVDARSDVYALGCVLYEALVGEPPFTGPSAMAVMSRQVTDPVRPITTVRPDVPEPVVAAVTRALAKAPADRFATAGGVAQAMAEPAQVLRPRGTTRSTVAVLPFSNLSADPENEYFSDGVTDDVIAQLAKVASLAVISRTSSTRFKESGKSLREIGSELGADVILEGTVRRAGGRVRVVVQLIDATTDAHRWSETYDRELTDVFEIQADVARKIAAALEAHLTPHEQARLKERPTDDLEAYDLYLLGRYHWHKRTDDGIRRAIAHFEQATERDSSYARAYAGLGDAYVFAGLGYATIPPAEALSQAVAAASRALELDPSLAEAHTALGFATLMQQWDPVRGGEALQRAAALDPNHAQAHQWLGWCRCMQGDYVSGLESFERALALDPLSPALMTESGWPFSYAGLHEQALARYRRALELDPTYALAHYNAGMALDGLGRFQDAVVAFERAVDLSGGVGLFKGWLAAGFARVGKVESAREVLHQLSEVARDTAGFAASIAYAHHALGEIEKAIDWLERAYADREPFVMTVPFRLHWLRFDRLEGHPRFEALVAEIGGARHDVEAERRKLEGWIAARRSDVPSIPTAATTGPTAAAAVRDEPNLSIVVRPFANTSPDPDTEYFADGLTEEIIADLTQVRALRVISRSSALRLKGSDRDARSLGRELGVGYVLEGSVRRSGKSLRITAQLVEAESDRQRWAGKYSGTIDEVFEIQEEVSRAIVDALRLQLTPEEERAIARRPTDDLRAYEAYLRARHEIWTWSKESLDAARRHLEQGLEVVGQNATLYATLGHAYAMYGQVGIPTEFDTFQRAEECVEKVAALDPDYARLHWLRGFVHFGRGDLRTALPHLERALVKDPDDPDALLMVGYLHALGGRMRSARSLFDRLTSVDPLTPITPAMSGFHAVLAGRFEEALEGYLEAQRRSPDSVGQLWGAAWANLWNRRVADAEPFVHRVRSEFAGSAMAVNIEALLEGVRGNRERTAAVLSAGLTEEIRNAARSSEMLCRETAHCLALAGLADDALEYLECDVEMGMVNYPFLAEHDWFLDGLRDDPRFSALLERVRGEWEAVMAEYPEEVGA